MKKRLFIVGCGGHGKVIADIAIKMKKYSEIYFLDDNSLIRKWQNILVLGDSTFHDFVEDDEIIIGIGNSKTREKLQKKYSDYGIKVATLIHPSAIIGTNVVIKEGTVIMAGAVINSDTIINEGCIINTGATIDHDNLIEAFSHISVGAHLAGTVKVGRHTWIGIGAIIRNNIEICAECFIGAGAVVVKNINKKGVYIGVPAKRKEEK